MARIPDAAGTGPVAELIRQRRPAGVLRPIDRMLLHVPRVAEGWNTLLGTLRAGTDLPADLRELAILRVAVLNGAAYEWDSHLPEAARAGIGEDQLVAVRRVEEQATGEAVLSAVQRAVLELTDVMTRELRVPDALFDELVERLGPEAVIELVVVVGAYNMVSRIVVALEITSEEAG